MWQSMDYDKLEESIMEMVQSAAVSHGLGRDRSSESNQTVASYVKAARRLSHQLGSQNTTDIASSLHGILRAAPGHEDNEHIDLPDVNSDLIQNGRIPMNEGFDFDGQDEHEMQWPLSGKCATFSTKGQARRGSHHGRGGRLPGSGAQVRKNYSKYARICIRKRLYNLFTMLESEKAPMVCLKFVREISPRNDINDQALTELSTQVEEMFRKELEKSVDDKLPLTVDHLPFCVVGVCSRFSNSDSVQARAGSVFNVRERHIVNTWLDRKGHVRCTCIGSTQYEIFALNKEFHSPCCVHAEAVGQILKELCEVVFGSTIVPFELFYNAFALIEPEVVGSGVSLFRTLHDGNSGVLICKDVCDDKQLCWVPIRKVQRSGGRYLCAFCDLVNTNCCHHITELRRLCVEGIVNPSEDPLQGVDNFEEENATPEPDPEPEVTSWSKNHQPVSYLPLAPVNCPVALRVDQEICDLVKRNGVFKLGAPALCIYSSCRSPRIDSTRQVNTSGVVMCSIGACSMEVDTYICSSCKKQLSAEGRNEGIFVDSICLAATHKLLRDQLTGFALGNGTLSSRLNQFHSQVTALEDAKLFQKRHSCKSVRTLYDLCVSFVRLMVYDPPKALFVCSTCQGLPTTAKGENKKNNVPRAICVDGIWAGYLKKASVPFENVSEPCNPIASFSRSVKSSFQKPRTTFFRLQRTIKFLIQGIKGHNIEVNMSSIQALSAAVRVVDETVLPVEFYQYSVCGTFPQDYKYDIGQSCLAALRKLTCALFEKNTLLSRLLMPLQRLFQKQGKRSRIGKGSSTKDHKKSLDIISCCLFNINTGILQEDEVVCWKHDVRPAATRCDLGLKMLQLYRALLQGPITHLIRREEIQSARQVAQACINYKPEEFMRAMVTRNCFSTCPQNENGDGSGKRKEDRKGDVNEARINILNNMRTLTGGLFSAAVVDKCAINECSQGSLLLPSFGEVLDQAVQCVSAFYAFYDEQRTNGDSDAARYARRWSSTAFSVLRDQFVKFSLSDRFQPSWAPDYNDMYVTGAFFPSFPQVRPLPFNDKSFKAVEEDAFGFCSKHYLQRNGSFTPGAITFACTCSHPIILGFKVLERDEGPRAVLDVLVSRFPTIPRFIIYDFACGVYKSAINTLWWVIEDSTLVSDPFHGCNHTCSPAFLPTAHVSLNMTNTIAHEQRNRPIAKIKGSLQQTSQDVYISLLAFQILINNIEAKGRTIDDVEERVGNRSAKDIEWAYFHRLQLTCECCNLLQDFKS